MAQVNDVLSSNLALVVVALVGICVALVILLSVLVGRVNLLRRRVDSLTRGVEGTDLEAVMTEHLESVFKVARDLDAASGRIQDLEDSAVAHFSRMGLIRFNPFNDMGSNQSFALALLDGRGNGLVVSSLHSRSGTRLYSKAVTGGRAEAALSDEEAQAIEVALGHKKRPTGAPAVRSSAAAQATNPRPPAADAPRS